MNRKNNQLVSDLYFGFVVNIILKIQRKNYVHRIQSSLYLPMAQKVARKSSKMAQKKKKMTKKPKSGSKRATKSASTKTKSAPRPQTIYIKMYMLAEQMTRDKLGVNPKSPAEKRDTPKYLSTAKRLYGKILELNSSAVQKAKKLHKDGDEKGLRKFLASPKFKKP